MRSITVGVFAMLATGAFAQIPAGPGQLPGTLPHAPPVIVPPPPVAPPPVPSAVTPLPSPRYGVPPGVTRAPSYGSGGLQGTIRSRPPKKKRKPFRKFRGSFLLTIQHG